jgi:tripartite-type tricarboxylate transporter receptor subunit TctC
MPMGVLAVATLMQPWGAFARDYYAGKTLTLLVGFGAGSGVTTQARIHQRHMSKHIPGNPTIIVKNMPGAGSAKASNFVFEKARPDGLTVQYGPVFAFNQIISAPGVRFKFEKFTFIGGALAAPRVMFMRKDAVPGGAKKSADIMKATSLKYVAVRPTVILSLYGRPALDMLGLKYRYIPGHRGGGKVRAAVQSGFGNIAMHGLSGYRAAVEKTQIQDGTSMPLWYFPLKNEQGQFVKSTLVPEFPSFFDVYKEITGKKPSGAHWKFLNLVADLDQLHSAMWGPPNMNKEAAAALSRGYYALHKDKAFLDEAKRIIGSGYEVRSLEFAKKYFDKIANLDPKMVKYSKGYLREGAKHMKKKKKK